MDQIGFESVRCERGETSDGPDGWCVVDGGGGNGGGSDVGEHVWVGERCEWHSERFTWDELQRWMMVVVVVVWVWWDEWQNGFFWGGG